MRKAFALLPAAALAVSLLGAVPARAGSGFTFHGSGYGHGIGMSQYGALGLARAGWSGEQIVEHYYTGVKVAQGSAPEPIRVGLLQDTGTVRLLAEAGPFDLVLQGGEPVESVPEGQRRTVEITTDKRYRILRPDGSEVATVGSAANPLLARRQGGGRIRITEWAHTVAHGELRFEISAPGRTHLLAVLPVEEYVYGVSEVPSSWPLEALRAQSIAARTYAYWRMAGALRPGCGCDVFATTADQAYVGWDKEAAPGGNRWVESVNATAGEVITHQGQPIYSAYSSSSGGYTEDIEKVWPSAAPLAYLRGRCDPGDDVPDNPNQTWAASFDAGQITSGLKPFTGDIGTVTGFDEYQWGPSGRVTYVRVVGTNGSKLLEGWDVRTALSLKDSRFSINRNLNITGTIREAYDRLRCRPGRAVTAQQGVKGGRWQAFTGGRLYEHLGRNKVTWLRGGVLRKYVQLGAHTSKLRLPYRVRKIKGGQRAWFDGGTITCAPRCRVRLR